MGVREVIIGFSKSKKKFPVFSWAIRFFDKSDFSHVYIKWVMKSGKPIVYQASGHAVNFVGNKRFNSLNTIVHEFKYQLSDESFSSFLDWAVDESGAPYSIKQAFGIALVKVFKLSKNPFHNSGFVCSEIVGRLMRDNLSIDVKDLELITPNDIYNICKGVM